MRGWAVTHQALSLGRSRRLTAVILATAVPARGVKIYTRTGDQGKSSLFTGYATPVHSPRLLAVAVRRAHTDTRPQGAAAQR